MTQRALFKVGDHVRHAAKPQWGIGRVETAAAAAHDGRPAQRLSITFANHGRTNLHTAFARLEHANGRAVPPPGDTPVQTPTPTPGKEADMITESAQKSPLDQFKTLPEAATDPLSTLGSRLRATLDLYHYSAEARSLLDWAVAQTQLDDPLSHFTRHELEQAFEAFATHRQRHLRGLVAAAKKAGRQEVLSDLARHPLPEAQRALAAALRAG